MGVERDEFMQRMGRARRAGLVAVGFVVDVSVPRTHEEIFAAMNEVDRAVVDGRCVRHAGWIGNEPSGILQG